MERNRTPSRILAVILGAQYLTSRVPHHGSSQKEAQTKRKGCDQSVQLTVASDTDTVMETVDCVVAGAGK